MECCGSRSDASCFVDLLKCSPIRIKRSHAAFIEPLLRPSLGLFGLKHPPIAGKFSTTIVFGGIEIACRSWNRFFLNLNHSISAPDFYGIYCYRSLACTCKLAKVCCLRNILHDGYREWESVISVKNGSCRSEIALNHSGKILSWS